MYGDLSHDDDTEQIARLVNVPSRNLFEQLDVDGDLTLSRREYAAAPQGQVIPFQYSDVNSDGVVSWEEFRGTKGPVNAIRFESMDADHDSVVSRAEFSAYYVAHTGSVPLAADWEYVLLLSSLHVRA